MRVLSLFDGIACGYEALLRAGIKVDAYYASEIDKYAIQIATKNHPDIIEVGDVTQLRWEDFKDIDLLIWGSPCQWFSVAGKQLNFNDPRSKLFFEFVRILKEVQPKYFLLENVKMKKEFQDKISELIGCEPIEINSSLVSAQSRKRLYWTNIPWVVQPNWVIEDIGIVRKLTPIECERLQTLPDNYTDGVSDTQRYKMLGNGWTVDVVSHIFKWLR